MLKVHIPKNTLFDQRMNEFIEIRECNLQLEHSLVSISKWEMKWHKPFIGTNKSPEETADYVRCMCMTPNVDELVFKYLPETVVKEIDEYIANPMTAATFSEKIKSKASKEYITNETIYWQMITLGIPVEFQKWHLNHLMALIELCSIKNNPDKKKMSRSEIFQRNRELNRARRAANHSAG